MIDSGSYHATPAIDPCTAPLYSRRMATSDLQGVTEQDLRALELRVDELIRACGHLKNENKGLKARQEDLLAERAELIEKTELARTRVEAMITRLKSLEDNT